MRISNYTCSVSRRAGGLLGAMQGLYTNSFFQDIDIQIYGYYDNATEQDLPTWKNIPVYLFRNEIFYYSRQACNAVLQSESDILHVHGLWRYPHMFMSTWKKRIKKPVIATPHGMLDPYIILQQGKLKQIVGKWLFAQKGFNAVTCFHALSMKELEDIRAYGLRQPVAIIPNGIHLPDKSVIYKKNDNKRHLLYLGRLHRKKGIDLLLKAIAHIKNEAPELLKNWTIDIVGWDHEGFKMKLQRIVTKHRLNDIVTFHGGLFGEEKQSMYVNADAYILSSYGEGLPMTVLEAWSYQLPVVMTPQCNIPKGFENNAAIKVEHDINSVKLGLLQLFLMTDAEREQMGLQGKKLVEESFTWDASAKKMIQLYQWILGQGEKPEFVYE